MVEDKYLHKSSLLAAGICLMTKIMNFGSIVIEKRKIVR